MCGITGFLNLNDEPACPNIVREMVDSLFHRGPDDSGVFTKGALGLGHTRLSILDLSSAGHQPMQSQDKRWTISYNGEIYNFRELRAELEREGFPFHSQTDTEVVLNAWRAWGPDALHRFNGMFAFALWDEETRTMFLARDRYGVKPVYFVTAGSHFIFGSEIKSILQHPGFNGGVNVQGLYEYFTFQNFFTEQTLFGDVKSLPAGSWIKVTSGGTASPAPVSYWDYNFEEPEHPASDEEYLEELDRLFAQAVKRQLVSDVEIGAYLSGGMDSGSITAVAAMQLPYIKSFTCGFDLRSASGLEMAFDERETAEYLSYLFKTEHYEMVLKAGDMERVMERLVWHIEEPRVGQSYPNFYAAQLAGKFVKVVLSGAGGDEMFGGYPWRYYRAVVNDDFPHYVDKYFDFWQRLAPQDTLRKMFAPCAGQVADVSTRDIFEQVFKHHGDRFTRPEDYVNHSLYFEAKTFMNGLLIVEDKVSMAHSLETRVPFLDNDLVDFAMRLPIRLKLDNLEKVVGLNENEPGPKTEKYFQKTRDGKILLRKVMDRYVPVEISRKEKQGFSAPDASWFRGESIQYVRTRLLEGSPKLYDFLDRKTVETLVQDHLDGRENRRLLIWSLLFVEEWLRKFSRHLKS